MDGTVSLFWKASILLLYRYAAAFSLKDGLTKYVTNTAEHG